MGPDLAWIMLGGLAAARVTVLLVHDTILEPVRERVYLRYPPRDDARLGFEYQRMDTDGSYLPGGIIRDWSMVGELLSCTRCMSVWVTAALLAPIAASDHWDTPSTVVGILASMWVAAWGSGRI